MTENVSDFVRLARYTSHTGIIFVLAKRCPRTRSGLYRLGEQLDRLLRDKRAPGPGGAHWLA